MDSITSKPPRFRLRLSLTNATLACILWAAVLGWIAHRSQNAWLLALSDWLTPWVSLWSNALELIILPLACSYLFVAIASPRQVHHPGRAIGMTFLLLSSMLLISTCITVSLAPRLLEGFLHDMQGQGLGDSQSSMNSMTVNQVPEPIGFAEWVSGLIPSNLATAFSRGQLLSALIITLMFGFSATCLKSDQRRMISNLVQCLADMSMTLIRWLLVFLPGVVFAVIYSLFTTSGLQLIGPLGWYVLVIVLLLFGFTLCCYPLVILTSRIDIKQFAMAAFPVQVVAVGTRSSMACMQPMFQATTRKLQVPIAVAELAVPLAVSLFRLSTSISTPFKLLFLLFVYGIEIDNFQLLSFLAANFIISLGTPGIPTRVVGVKFPLYLSLGIPAEGVIILGAIDAVPDMFKTLLNVTSSLLAVTILSRWIYPSQGSNQQAAQGN